MDTETRSTHLENAFVGLICAVIATALLVPIWLVPLKGAVLLGFFAAGGLFALLSFQLFINAIFRSKKNAHTSASKTFWDAVIDILLFR